VHLVLVGCARHSGDPGPASEASAPESDISELLPERDLISEEEIATVDFQSVYEVVQALRPQWLRSRGITSFIDPRPDYAEVFVDGTEVGEISYLWLVSAIHVKELRFWGPEKAGVKFGMGYPRGVIEIVSKGIPD
jgi:hypothetical protein